MYYTLVNTHWEIPEISPFTSLKSVLENDIQTKQSIDSQYWAF